jgi:hypothetical protein
MIGFIYYLQNPITEEIFYVGATQTSLKNRLRTHYQHLREYERGLRLKNKRYEYLANLRPNKAKIVLLEVAEDNVFKRETHYIDIFRRLCPNLTNQTDGNHGGDTFKYQTPENKILIGDKISQKLTGISRTPEFIENLSRIRTGVNNPAAGRSKIGWLINFDTEGNPIKLFKFGFEINKFLNSKYAYGNVSKFVDNDFNNRPYGYIWKSFSKCSKEIQDIVESTYESL